MVVVVVEGKKAADSASDQRKDAALGIGQWQEVRKERERNVNEREKLSYFVWEAVLYSRERGWSYRFETKKWFQRGRNIFWRVSFFFLQNFPLQRKVILARFDWNLLLISIIHGVIVKSFEKKLRFLRLHEWRIFDIVSLILFFSQKEIFSRKINEKIE